MNQQMQATTGKAVSVIENLRRGLDQMEPQFKAALPAHIPVERFKRVAVTALQNNPKLQKCTPRSLWNAFMKCAQDGLLPDGREAAIVPFGENEDGRKVADTAAYMIMIAGLRKKARNSGEISDWFAEVVHDGDHWRYEKGETPIIEHIPARGGRKRPIIAAYSICRLKDGTLSREWMWIEEIEEIRAAYSRSRKGPWSDPVAYPEMCKKTVARLHSKVLPMSTDLDDVIRRDDDLYDFKKARQADEPATKNRDASPSTANAMLEHFGAGDDHGDPRPGDETVIEHDEDGVAIENGEHPSAQEQQDQEDPVVKARQDFIDLLALAEKKPPTTGDAFRSLVTMLVDNARTVGGTDGAAMIKNFWQGTLARKMRNAAGLTKEETDAITTEVAPIINDLMKAS